MILTPLVVMFWFFVVVGVIISVAAIVKKEASSRKGIAILFLVFVLGVVTLRYSFPWWPIGLRHLCYVANNEDLYSPFLLEPFDFNAEGQSKRFSLTLDYYTAYTIGIRSATGNFPEDFAYKGKIKADFYKGDKLIYSSISDEPRYHKSYRGEGGSKLEFKKIGLVMFEVPVANWYSKDIEVVVTVLEPDQNLNKFEGELNLYVGIDWLL